MFRYRIRSDSTSARFSSIGPSGSSPIRTSCVKSSASWQRIDSGLFGPRSSSSSPGRHCRESPFATRITSRLGRTPAEWSRCRTVSSISLRQSLARGGTGREKSSSTTVTREVGRRKPLSGCPASGSSRARTTACRTSSSPGSGKGGWSTRTSSGRSGAHKSNPDRRTVFATRKSCSKTRR